MPLNFRRTINLITLTLILAVILGLASGCAKKSPTPAKTSMPPAHTSTPYVPPPVSTELPHTSMVPPANSELPGNGLPGNTGGPLESPLNDQDRDDNRSAAPQGSASGVQGLADALLTVPEVDSGVVVKLEQVCMAGVTYGEQFRGSMSSTVEDRIKVQLAAADDEKNTIFVVTSNQELVEGLIVLAQQIRAGNVPAELMEEFDRLLRQALV